MWKIALPTPLRIDAPGSVGLYVRLSVCRCQVHCGKTADRSGCRRSCSLASYPTGPGMRHVVGFGDRSTGRGTFGGEFGARHCNQWELYGVHVRQCGATVSGDACGGPRHCCILDGGPRRARRRGRFGGFLFSIFTMGIAIGSPTVKCFGFVCEKFTFPFGKHIVGKPDSWAFWRYINSVSRPKLGVYEKLPKT